MRSPEEKKQYSATYREANREIIRIKKREHYQRNRKKIRAQQKAARHEDINKTRKYYRDYRIKNGERLRELDNLRYEKDKTKVIARRKVYYRKNAATILAAMSTPNERRAARTILRLAVRDGKIVKPDRCSRCHKCVEEKRLLHGHHHDYNKPLDVEWLCSVCHGKEHRI